MTQDNIPYVVEEFGPWKMKDKLGRGAKKIDNKSGAFMVIKEIQFSKVKGENNKIAVRLIMPDPEFVDVMIKGRKEEK